MDRRTTMRTDTPVSGRVLAQGRFGCALLLAAGTGLLGLPAASSELGHPVVRDFPPGKSRIGYLCHAITQDGAGFIYIGNGTELRCHDGETWRIVDTPTYSAGVRKFAVTDDGTVYAGGAGLIGWIRGSGDEAEFVSLADQLPPSALGYDEINDALAIGDTVWFADEEKILVWRDERFTVIPYPAPAYSGGARLHRVGDVVFVTALGRPLCRLIGDRPEVLANDPLFRENQIVSVEPGPDGNSLIVLTTERGLWQFTDGQSSPVPVEANRWLQGKRILRAQRLPDGGLAVIFAAVSGYGGMRFDREGRYVGAIDNAIGLYVQTLRDLFCDREGGLWLGSETGLFRIEWPSGITLFDAINGLGQGAVTGIVRHEGTLFVATSEGVYRLFASDADGRGARFERIHDDPTYALVSHPGGLLAVGYRDVGVFAPDGFRSIAALPPGGGSAQRSSSFPDRIWIATTRGLQAVKLTPAGWSDEGALHGFDADCTGLMEDATGTLWVATVRRGLFRIKPLDPSQPFASPPVASRIADRQDLPKSAAPLTVQESAGQPVVFTPGLPSAYRFNLSSNHFTALLPRDSFANEGTNGTWVAADGDASSPTQLWFANAAEVVAVPADGGPPRRLPRVVTAATGSVTRLREEAGPNGPVLWVGGERGLARIEIDRAFPASVAFTTLLTADGVHAGEELPASHTALTFRYVALRHQIEHSVAYQTRLIGYDRDWSPWSSDRERQFDRLPAGRHRFEVRARDADGQFTPVVGISFQVFAPWWQSPFAYLGYVAVGIGLLVAAERLRTRALRHQAQRLQAIVAERTAALARQNAELVRLNQLELDEKIAARLGEERARLEVLRYQLNPHFLFNTLASISSTLPPGGSTARAMVDRLAEFCRLTLYRPDQPDWTTLGGELRLLRTYLEIEQSRWGDLLDVEIECDDALAAERLPHFLLLPLIENALKYGRATSPDRVGIRLGARRDPDGTVVLEVSNTGEWVEPTAERSVSSLGIGLGNLRERLARHYPGSHRLDIGHVNGQVTVTLSIFHQPVL